LAADRVVDRLTADGYGDSVMPTLMSFVTISMEGEPARRRVDLSVLNEAERQIVQAFIDARLLTSDQQGSTAVVEITQEALLYAWPPLRQRIEAYRDTLQRRADLERWAYDWERADRQDDYLIFGSRLTAARRWTEENPYITADSPLLREFLDISVIKSAQPIRQLRVFLCHSSSDKPIVRGLYEKLRSDSMQPWLDEEDLLPGQDWETEIRKAIRASDVVLVCLSKGSITKVGYVQKEIRDVLDVADEQPEGTIFLIPVRLEPIDMPDRFRRWQWVDLFQEPGYERLIRALHTRATMT
jgi:hypothetical protein